MRCCNKAMFSKKLYIYIYIYEYIYVQREFKLYSGSGP